MSQQRIIGIVLLVVGVVILLFGMNAKDTLGEQVNEAVTGRYSDRTMWYIIGGIGLGVLGLLMSVMGPRGKGA